jgi:hypothetical protein
MPQTDLPYPRREPTCLQSNAYRSDEVTFADAIRALFEQARNLEEEVGAIGEPPTSAQLKAVQAGLERMQRKLNGLQTAVDSWTVETQV